MVDSTGKQGMEMGWEWEREREPTAAVHCYHVTTCLHDEQSDFSVEAGLRS